MNILALLVLLLVTSDPTQIAWERSVPDAVALAAGGDHALLIGVNMDGESASERIGYENYKDPAFIAASRHFVCLMSSVFRHSPRDYDERGLRVPCPRLGVITCGEHAALEPVVYDRFLGGERIAPRHAIVRLNGEKVFDLSLLFDLAELDRRLIDVAAEEPVVDLSASVEPFEPDDLSADASARAEQWRRLASARGNDARTRFEELVATEISEALAREALASIAVHGNEGSVDALRVLLTHAARFGDRFAEDVAAAALKLELATPIQTAAFERLEAFALTPRDARLGGHASQLVVLAQVAPDATGTRTLLLSYAAAPADPTGAEAASVTRALDLAYTPEVAARVRSTIGAAGGPVDLRPIVRPFTGDYEPRVPPGLDERTEEQTRADLDAALTALAAIPDGHETAAAWSRFGTASLRMAELQIESGGSDAALFLKDAEAALSHVAEEDGDAALALARARLAYRLGAHEDEERHALAALERLGPPQGALADSALHLDALRWLGDATARRLAARAGQDPLAEAAAITRGLHAYAGLCGSAAGNATDWTSLASMLGLLGRQRDRIAVALAGIDRFPESAELRNELNHALWMLGRTEEVATLATELAARRPDSGFAAWYEGYGNLFHAEWQRRQHRPAAAVAAYDAAERAFERAAELAPNYEASCLQFRARARLGQGFAWLLAQDQERAAASLVSGIALDPTLVDQRDGLDREPIDLLDGALERRNGVESPVHPLALLDELAVVDPENSYWPHWVSDSMLREGLRADGRGERMTCHGYLRFSVLAAERAVELDPTDANRRALAQGLTIEAELLLERGVVGEVATLLDRAARVEGGDPPPPDASHHELAEVAARMRDRLGEARPLSRPGR